MLYFAYGYNMDVDAMRRACPTAAVVGPGMLTGFELVFDHSVGPDDATWANLVGVDSGVVWGVIYDVPEHEFPALDNREQGYDRVVVEVASPDGFVPAYVYISDCRTAADDVPGWYVDAMVASIEAHGLPREYADEVVLSAYGRS